MLFELELKRLFTFGSTKQLQYNIISISLYRWYYHQRRYQYRDRLQTNNAFREQEFFSTDFNVKKINKLTFNV
jgi:hypothetical protein